VTEKRQNPLWRMTFCRALGSLAAWERIVF